MLKSAEKMTESVLRRRDQELAKKQKRAAWGVPAAIAVVLTGLFVYTLIWVPTLYQPGVVAAGPAGGILSREKTEEIAEKARAAAQGDQGGSDRDGDPSGYSGGTGETSEATGTAGLQDSRKAWDPSAAAPVELPAVEIEPPKEGVMADMIGLVVHNGAVYTAGGQVFWNEEAKALQEKLLGEHLGKTLPIVDCFSHITDPDNKWQQLELASTYEGELYTVKGYDPGFRLAIVNSFEGGEEPMVSVEFLENLNGLTLYSGENLFGEERLNLRGRVAGWALERHEDWDSGLDQWTPLEPGEEAWSAFLNGLFQAGFENTWETDPDIYGDPERRQVHVKLALNDGTTAQLRVWEDGHVAYAPLGWVMARMDPQAVAWLFEE